MFLVIPELIKVCGRVAQYHYHYLPPEQSKDRMLIVILEIELSMLSAK